MQDGMTDGHESMVHIYMKVYDSFEEPHNDLQSMVNREEPYRILVIQKGLLHATSVERPHFFTWLNSSTPSLC